MHFANELRKTLSGGRTGRLYKVSKKGPLHQASAPGEPPAVLFGKLKQGIFAGRAQWEGWQVTAEVGVGGAAKKYARRLDWGGVDSRGVRILPRPYVEPTVLRTQDEIERLLSMAVATNQQGPPQDDGSPRSPQAGRDAQGRFIKGGGA